MNINIWPSRRSRMQGIEKSLIQFSRTVTELPGAASSNSRQALSMQMVASLRRIDYINILLSRSISASRVDLASDLFDPERAALQKFREGNLDEAVWLLFLATHFGKHLRHGWTRVRDVYSGLNGAAWTYERVSSDVSAFRRWIDTFQTDIAGGFGNHRKYESLNGNSRNGTGAVVESYVRWINGTHEEKFSSLVRLGGNNPHNIFSVFYKDMIVHRFGRLAKFDFLALLGRMQFAPLRPGSTYLKGSTGPLRGARLLFGGDTQAPLGISYLEDQLLKLDEFLNVGAQVIEDSICNWQKSPNEFIHFKG